MILTSCSFGDVDVFEEDRLSRRDRTSGEIEGKEGSRERRRTSRRVFNVLLEIFVEIDGRHQSSGLTQRYRRARSLPAVVAFGVR